jgi:bifunctional DNA-binding transcriptional regulator/antitoxin component of YhaV-PrlF toxin-antitoxin module
MKHTFQVRVSRRGTITMPRELRNHNKIEEGTLFKFTDLGNGVLILSQLRSSVDTAANILAKEWRQQAILYQRC